MAVTYNATGAGNRAANGGGIASSLSWSHTCTSAGVLIAAFTSAPLWNETWGPTDYTRSVTYNSVAMTPIVARASGDFTAGWVELWGMLSPPDGAHTVAVSVTGHTITSLTGSSVSYVGAQSLGTGVSAAGNSTAPSLTVPSATGDMVVAAVCSGVTISAPTDTQRVLDNTTTGQNASTCLLIEDQAGAASAVLGATIASNYWAVAGVNLSATAVASSSLYVRSGSSWVISPGAKIRSGSSWANAQDPGLL